ncbi:hypothetical protein BOTBODRAFT_171038 [Botryobasidium botryosum FD-172 SS1]|uniref:non-specific serine/threonine protein kinase n=1 Tax=Botryobasidium botryosum (strain FD-172 SS1) TaxID=930990 RepID=A0A067N5M6_BOTB1|nr:hypothetical protein BOTBODRAFT_171038 [Botryobasidium botryosum FD-172 SS1]
MSLSLPAQLLPTPSSEITILQRTDILNINTHFVTTDASIFHKGKRFVTFRATLSRKGQKGAAEERDEEDGVRWNPYCRPRQVVCKVATEPATIKLLINETAMYLLPLRSLQGKYVPLFHGMFEGFMQGKAAACIVMDYCGVPLKVALNRVDRHLLVKVASAAVAIHEAGIIHNDLCERNIVCLDDRPFIIDFETAVPHKCLRAQKVTIGGPEPFPSKFGCDELFWFCSDEMADLWSPGGITYFDRYVPIEHAESAAKLAKQAPEGIPEDLALLGAEMAIRQLAININGYRKKFRARLPMSECV